MQWWVGILVGFFLGHVHALWIGLRYKAKEHE